MRTKRAKKASDDIRGDRDLTLEFPSMKRGKVRKVCRILKLDTELFVLIASKLPLQNIFQLRCVCKTWRAVLTEDPFLQYFFGLLCQTPMYTATLDNGFATYSFELKTWHRWTSALDSRYLSRYKVYGQVGDQLLVKDVSLGAEYSFQILCLANPGKWSRRELPSVPQAEGNWDPFERGSDDIDYGTVRLIPGESSKSFKVFVVRPESTEPWDAPGSDCDWLQRRYWYDSELDSWTTPGKAILFRQGEHREGIGSTASSLIFYQGALHCIIRERDEVSRRLISTKVCRYDERKSCWQALSAQILETIQSPHLFEWQGHLMLVGGRNGGQHNASRIASVHIWQLDKEDHVWVESRKMPDHILDHFYASDTHTHGCYMSVKICGDRICLTRLTYDTKSEQHRCIHIMYDLITTLWCAIPELPFAYETFSDFFCLVPNSRGF